MNLAPYIDIAKLAHGSFNTLLALAFLYQAWMGLRIRRGRKKGEARPAVVKRHRKIGPVLVVLGVLGFCAGLTLVLIDKGQVLVYPLHLAVGALIVLFLLGQYAVSRRIKGLESPWRTPHLAIGVGIVLLYVFQILVGLSVLL
jgi:low temperature requirement protein LtrA